LIFKHFQRFLPSLLEYFVCAEEIETAVNG